MEKTTCTACYTPIDPENAVEIRAGDIKFTLCRACMEEIRHGMDALGPDRALASRGGKYTNVTAPAACDRHFLMVCGGTAQRLKKAESPAEPVPVPPEIAIKSAEQARKLGHLPQPDDLTEYLIPVLCTGVKYARIKSGSYADAIKQAERKIDTDNRYSSGSMQDFKAHALAPELMLKPEDRASWPYWGYGWTGTDGIDWRAHRTDEGPGSIPDIAEESWPIPPYGN